MKCRVSDLITRERRMNMLEAFVGMLVVYGLVVVVSQLVEFIGHGKLQH